VGRHRERRLHDLRHTEPAVALGDFRMLLPDHEQVYAFTRTLAGTSLLVLVNVSGTEQAVDLPDADRWAGAELVLGNLDGDPAAGVPLRPWEARVHRVTGVG
jgi:oligo-1,6-glucosidase